jgi:DNA sulfur modification protein DndD
MKLAGLRLVNWKAFRSLDIALNAQSPGNVVIIEGSNGFGKTSILEAILLGLFGREGVALVGRGTNGRSDSYDGFLERALFSDARGQNATMSVELAFEGTPDDRIVVQRSWYFTAAGRHRSGDEEVRIWSGPDDDIVPIPQGEEMAGFAQDLIGERLLPVRLAPFFLFDGEQLERIAGESLESQVRLGFEAALGIPLLRTISQDLLAFARENRRGIKGDHGSGLDSVVQLLGERDNEAAGLAEQVEELGRQIEPLRQERDQIVARIGSLSGESYANFKQLFEQREQLVRVRDDVQERLRQVLSSDLALALAGPGLRSAARARLDREAVAEQAQAATATSDARFAQFMEQFEQSDLFAHLERPQAQSTDLSGQLKALWEATRTGQGDTVAVPRHSHLTDSDRHLVKTRFGELDGLAGDAIAELAHAVERADRAVEAVDSQIADQRGADEQSRTLAAALRDTQQRIGELEEASRSLGRSRDALRSEIATLQREKARLLGEIGDAEPAVRRAGEADLLASVIDTLIAQLFPLNLQLLSEAVTHAYRAMAHKDQVAAIEIRSDGAVGLRDREGRDIRQYDLSAGEKQLFAFAVMAAIVLISPPFPLILDTPLARLDPEHRHKVLHFLARLDRQVIFLSQPAELSSPYRETIGDHLAQTARLEHHAGMSRLLNETRSASAVQ